MLYCKSFTKPVFSIALSFHHLFMLHDQIIFIIKNITLHAPWFCDFLFSTWSCRFSTRLLANFTWQKQPSTGAPGYITTSLLNGMSFVEGWESKFFISKWCMQQLVCFYILIPSSACSNGHHSFAFENKAENSFSASATWVPINLWVAGKP
jgi:hypothetical protein